jgi:uncharacterized membrane protein required for colicin V production
MTRVDWIALAIAGVAALSGLKRGLIATALSLAGLAAGAVLGARVAPHFLHGGSISPYTPLVGLGGAVVGATLLQTVASIVGSFARGSLSVIPPLRSLDSVGGLVAGAALGLCVVWVGGAVLLQLPGQTSLRAEVQHSRVLQRLNEIAPPSTILRAFHRVDPFPSIAGPAPPALPPDRRALSSGAVRRLRPSVLRITATACGLGVEGTGWVAKSHLVVTASRTSPCCGCPGCVRRRSRSSTPTPATPWHWSATPRTARSTHGRGAWARPPTSSSTGRCAR